MEWVINVEFRYFINQVDEEEKLQLRKEQLEDNQILRAERTLATAVADLRNVLDGQCEVELEDVDKTARNLRQEALDVLNRLEEVRKQPTEDREQFCLSGWRRTAHLVHLS